MANNESGAPPEGRAPNPAWPGIACNSNSSAKPAKRKSPFSTLSEDTTLAATACQLENYFQLGLSPIPLHGKLPLNKWTQFHPHNLNDLKSYLRPGVNWGVKTGQALTVIDFDTKQAFIDFCVTNLDKLSPDTPIVKTGRGYHVWVRCKAATRNQHYLGVDIKGEGGYVVAPPSIHPNGRTYKFIRPPGKAIPFVDLDELVFPREKDDRLCGPKPNVKGGKTSSGETRKGFDWAAIGNGVEEGERHTFLVQFVGVLCATDQYLLDDILEITREQNKPQ